MEAHTPERFAFLRLLFRKKRDAPVRVTLFFFSTSASPSLSLSPLFNIISSTKPSDRDGLVTLDELAAFGAAAFAAASSSSSHGGGGGTFCEAVRGAAALSAAAELSGGGGEGGGRGRGARSASSLLPPCPRCDEDREELSHAARERAADWLLSLVVADDAVRSAVRGEGSRRPDASGRNGGDPDGGGGGRPSSSSPPSRSPPPPPPLVHSASLRALVELLAPFDEEVGGCSGGGCSYDHFHHPGAERGRAGAGAGAGGGRDELERQRRSRTRRRRDREEEDDRAFAAIFASLKAAARAAASTAKNGKPLPTSKRQTRDGDGGDSGESDSDDDDSLADWVPASSVRHLGKGAIDGVARLLGRVCGESGGREGEEGVVFGGRRKRNLGDDNSDGEDNDDGDGDGDDDSAAPCDLCCERGREEGSVARRLWDVSVSQAV